VAHKANGEDGLASTL